MSGSASNIPFTELAVEDILDRFRDGGGSGIDVDYIPLVDPIPATELLARIEDVLLRSDADNLEQFNLVTLVPDTHNTYVYGRFVQRTNVPGFSLPLSGALVELMDQDAPPPTADDVAIPIEETKTVFENEKRIVTVTTEFLPPTSDELIDKSSTDASGLVRFVLRPDQIRTTGGTVVTQTTTENLQTGEVMTVTSKLPITERGPDVYFRAHTPSGGVVDTRFIAAGLIVNLESKRIGAADAPLTFEFGGPVIGPIR